MFTSTMFPSARHFAGTNCPFVLGRCERPYCLYKHRSLSVCGDPGTTGHDHILDPSPHQNTAGSSPRLLELERINKQIEAVRSEVEKEQQRLSRYQSEQGASSGTGSDDRFKSRPALSKDHKRNQMKSKKTTTCKYVVDRTRPKTDLEYDPCSNFSADLRSGSSVDKMKAAHKADVEDDQRYRETGTNVCDCAQVPSCSFEDSDEGTLIIDIPPFENGGRSNRSQTKRTAGVEAKAVLVGGGGDRGGKGISRKGANIIKISGGCSERGCADAGSSLLEKNVDKAGHADKDMTSITNVLDSPESNRLINIPHQENEGKTNRSAALFEHGPSLGIGLVENEKHVVSEEPEVHGDTSAAGHGTMFKGPKHSPRAIKGDEAKKWISKQPVTIMENFQEPQENADVARSAQVCHLYKPVCADMSLNGYEEKGQNMGCVLDDINMCLDHLRPEGGSSTCLQHVEDLLDSAPDCSQILAGCEKTSPVIFEQSMNSSRTELCPQQNNFHSNSAHKAEYLTHTHAQQEPVVFQDYFPNMPSFSAMTKVAAPGPSSSAFAETCWLHAQNGLPQPFVPNVPVSVSGMDTVCVPSAQSAELLSSVTSPVALTPGQTLGGIPQKPPAPVASRVTCAAVSDSRILSPAIMDTSSNEVVQVDSSSSDELNYSDFDLSDTDPMEECYNIFMESNGVEHSPVQADVPQEVSQSETDVPAQPPPAQKKRVAHVAKFEQVSKNRAQVIVPLREGADPLPSPSPTQQCQKRAVALTSAFRGCQSFITATVPRRVIAPAVFHQSPAPNSCVSILPVGTTLRLGSDLHLIVPEGNCALPITLIPATVPVTRPLQPIQRPLPVQPANYTPAKAMSAKRKAKGRAEMGVKVPHDVRQRYVNLFVEEFLKTSATVQDAFEKALAEEKTVFDRSVNKLKYLSIAVNALKRLKHQNTASDTFSSERNTQVSRGNVPLHRGLLGDAKGEASLYTQLKEHILTESLLRENNYPRKHPCELGVAVQYGHTKKSTGDACRRICCRCGAMFSVSQTGKHTRKEECNYHSGKVIENRVPGGVETRYSCCESAVGSPGCQVFKLHVHDTLGLQGFVQSLPQTRAGCPGVYAVATEMCYTTHGLEVVRVTLVNSSLQVVYDTFVKPNNEVIDYNTRYSGVSEDEVKASSPSLQEVQAVLLSFISKDTILVGHGLENDLCALKLLHSAVVDTCVMFPHRLGPPHKRELSSLTTEILRRIIQESGRDARDHAEACMELVLWKVKEDSKVKRW
ncbi:uncharacterized protein LOC143476996 isoform X2 [Brachyhypopomus gauderio]|uniref:uncharacterized protein LOC143476996 isoform X2 n=1 Tax=Brachyhypopomus gauderio TaxID=698409 RepID=UPI004042BB9C